MDTYILVFALGIIVTLICLYFYNTYISYDNNIHSATPLSQETRHDDNEVFHVSGNQVTYDDAPDVCKQLDSRLATYDEVLHAYQHGAEWCNYGWSQDQLALYPTQKETWEKFNTQKTPRNATCVDIME